MANRRAGRVVARLGVLVESANLLALSDVAFDAACAAVLAELGGHLHARAGIEWGEPPEPTGPEVPPSPHDATSPITSSPITSSPITSSPITSSPIAIGQRHLGSLVVHRHDTPSRPAEPFDDDELLLVQDVATQLAAGWVLRHLPAAASTRAVLEAGFDDAPVGVLLIGPDGTLLRVNRAFATIVGGQPQDWEGRRWTEALVPGPDEITGGWTAGASDSTPHRLVQQRYRRCDGSTVRTHVVLTTVFHEGPDHPDERVLLAQVLVAASPDLHGRDELTGVATRHAAFSRLGHALDRLSHARHGRGVAVAVVDLDHFTALNEAYGHEKGDEVLRQVAAALRQVERDHDLMGRLGGDEFVLIFDEVGAEEANGLAEGVAAALEAVSTDLGDGLHGKVGGSIGLAWTDRALDVREFVARAQRGVREAKRHGRGRVWRDVDHRRRSDEGSTVTARELQQAIERDEFELHYQPIVDSNGHHLRAVEALLRWNHPSGRQLSPAHFLRELLESGQINRVGQWALQRAVAQLAQWRTTAAGAELVLNLNISPAELADAEWATLLSKAIADAGVAPESICVELTEQAMVGTVVSRSGLHRLAATGTRLALDDFGTGVSSLSHLRVRPLHGIKIDRSFIAGVGGGGDDRHIVRALIDMAAGLGLEVTAEGVETEDQAEWLAEAGCHLLQGWQFSRAVDADAIGRMMELQPS